MKALLSIIISFAASSVMATTVSELHCKTINGVDTLHIEFQAPIDPVKPFIGWPNIPATLEVHPYRSNNIYKTAIHFVPLKGGQDINLRGGAAQDGVYLQLFPEVVNGEATGHYTGQAFINDLDVRAYFDFRSRGTVPGMRCE